VPVHIGLLSVQLYRSDQAPARHYLDLFGVTHAVPYAGTNEVGRLVARIAMAFFGSYVLSQVSAPR
jgi:hypothetical protein